MQVFNKLKRSLSMASAILIGLSNFTPIIAEAQGAVSDVSTYKVIVENFTSYENQKPLKGATYDFNLVANKKADGSYEELSTPQKIASKTIGSTDKEIFFETSKEGRYQVVQTSRPDGYYLGQGFDQAGKVAEISFPQMENGLESTNKEVRLSPKFTKIVKSVEIQKLGEDNDQLNNTTFTLTPGELNQNHDTEDEAVRTINVTNNKLVLENLVEGKYTLQEKTAQDGYGLDNRPIDIEVSAPKDATSPDQVTVKVTRNNVEIEGLVINNYKVPTPGANSNGKPFDKLVKGPKDQGFVKKTKVGKGEEVQYKIDIDVPTDIKNYNKFVFYDKLDDALEFNPNTFKELNSVTSTPTPSEKYYSIADAIKVKDNPDLTLVKFKGLDLPADKADQVKEGGQVEITTTVKDGYKITKILVNGKEMTGNTFTLTQVPTNVEIVTEKVESEISRLRIIPSASSQLNITAESVDGTLRELNNNNPKFPLNYGDKFDVIEVNKTGTNTTVKTLIKHSDTKNFPIVRINRVNGNLIEVEDINGSRRYLQIDNADIFSSKRFGKLAAGTSIQFKKSDSNEQVAEVISLLGDQALKGSLVNNSSPQDITQVVGTLIEVKKINEQWMMTAKIDPNLYDMADKQGMANFYISEEYATALKNNIGARIAFKTIKNAGQSNYSAFDIRFNESAKPIPAKLFSFFKPIKANALEVEEGEEPIAVTSGNVSPQETYINSIDISSLGDNPNTFIKNGVLISYDPATKTIVGKIIDPKSFTNKHITVNFSAKVLENKTIYNDVTVIYDNGKGSTGTPNLPQDKQPVVVGEAGKITIKKIDGKTNALLQGAEFKLMVKENDTWVDFNATTEGNTNATNAQGLLVFKDLPIREYKLVETKAPVVAGKTYNLTKEEIIIDLTKTAEVERVVANYDSETWIPRTGTMGMLPYILGAVILAGAGICLERKSKR